MSSTRKAVWDISYGVYIITSMDGEKKNGQIITTAFQVTSDPPRVAICVNKETLTHEYITKSRKIGISVLEQDVPMTFIGTWGFKSGRDIDKFKGINYKVGVTGVPLVLDHTLSVMEVDVKLIQDVSTHTLFIGEVVNSEIIKDGVKLTYEYYQKEMKGKAPKTAPTYHG
ncbi:MAG: flavin reductase family protein [Proteobacteria bacterium]|nr:flavin reductase family protein [Pseudomonadota bacterium]